MESRIWPVAKKEIYSYFTSPIASIFLGVFLLVSMFVFFWVDKFFARNIADVRPLFDWMPILLIFLVSALTMRMWSEERRMGTIEFLMTVPVKTRHLVIGKFIACMILIGIAVLLTIGVPMTVARLGDLDWGPIVGAYLATMLLAGAYTSVGLYVSAKTENQIVSLIVTALVCSLLYLLGSETLTALLGNKWGEIFKLLGTGSRFESINRGVIDIRDLYYYVSIIAIFLTLNTFVLEKLRWSTAESKPSHTKLKFATTLLIANFVVANLWLSRTSVARADLTEGHIYSVSPATKSLIAQLQEPLLIRGYFSAKTHPLLAPLVPQIRDLIEEYGVIGKGKIRVEFVDPKEDPEVEEEAARKYNIKPVPFQIPDRYEVSLVNSYFNVLIQYGDQFEVLGFENLIEVQPTQDRQLDVRLRNPEYDITRTIKKVLYGFKGTDNLFASLTKPVNFVGYFSPDAELPEALGKFKGELVAALGELKRTANGKFDFSFVDPSANGGDVAKEIEEKYGFRPMVANILDPKQFFFYMTLDHDGKTFSVPLPENLTADGATQSLEGALKRLSPGFLKTIGLVVPEDKMNPQLPPQLQMMQQRGNHFRALQEKLAENYKISDVKLVSGSVPEDVDILMILSPENLAPKQLFAIDQFLMKGGTVVLATSPFGVTQSESGISVKKINSGLKDWLGSYGIKVDDKFALDTQNEAFPVPRQRNVAGFMVQEMQMVNYPMWVDVRSDGMNKESGLMSGVPQVTINWASPVEVDSEKNKNRTVTPLLSTTHSAWLTDGSTVQPNLSLYPRTGFPPAEKEGAYTLATIVEGKFDSYFKGKNSPLLDEAKKEEQAADGAPPADDKSKEPPAPVISNVIDRSTDSARIILFGSNMFLADEILQVSASSGSSRYLNSLQIMENAVDWSLEDRALLSIRGRGHFSRTLIPMEENSKVFWEYLNYGLVLIGLGLVIAIARFCNAGSRRRYEDMLKAAA